MQYILSGYLNSSKLFIIHLSISQFVSQLLSVEFLFQKKMNVWILFFLEIFTSEVAWPNFSNNITLKCHKGNVVMQNYTDQCEFKPKCVLEYRDQSILFFCSGKYMLNDTGIICIYWKFVNYFKRWY